MKLNCNKHYVNKSHTKHFYNNKVFTNKEWLKYISGDFVQGIQINVTNKYRKIPEYCDRWYNQDNNSTTIAKSCPNKPFYKSNTNLYFCKSCARAVDKINNRVEFTRIMSS